MCQIASLVSGRVFAVRLLDLYFNELGHVERGLFGSGCQSRSMLSFAFFDVGMDRSSKQRIYRCKC